jgi:hypothetical protein
MKYMMRKVLLTLKLIACITASFCQNSLPSTGNIGVNTTSPHAPLHVVGGAAITAGWNKTSVLEATFPVLLMNSANQKWAGIGYDFSTAMRFWVNASSDDLPLHGRNPLTILNNGYVGVGTGNPVGQLHVNTEASNALTISRYGSNTFGFEIGGATFGLYDYTNTKFKWFVQGDNLLLNPYSGKTGIGTTEPVTLLHLHEEADKDTYVHLTNLNTGKSTADGLELSANKDLGANVWNYENGYLRFATSNAEQMRITSDGKIGVGTHSPSEKLSVNGNVKAKKIIVSQTGWPDYVFDSSYALRSLSEVEKFIAKNKHLPDMLSAKEVEENGISIGDAQALLLKKIEELTLYIIAQDKVVQNILTEQAKLKSVNQELQNQIKKMRSKN